MLSPRAKRSISIDLLLAGAVIGGLQAAARPAGAARLLELDETVWPVRLQLGGLAVAAVALCVIARHLGRRMLRTRRKWAPRRGAEAGLRSLPSATGGTVMVEFALVFPLLLLVSSMIVQIALFANASLVVRYAAFQSARTAVVNYRYEYLPGPPDWIPFQDRLESLLPWRPQAEEEIKITAELILAGLSPRAGADQDSVHADAALAMERVLRASGGVWAGRDYADRMRYAHEAIEIETYDSSLNFFLAWLDSMPGSFPASEHLVPPALLRQGQVSIPMPTTPLGNLPALPIPLGPIQQIYDAITQYLKDPMSPKQVRLTLTYDFRITLPGLLGIIPGLTVPDPITNEPGRAFPIEHTVWLQSTGSREGHLTAMFPWKKLFGLAGLGYYEDDPIENLPVPFVPNFP